MEGEMQKALFNGVSLMLSVALIVVSMSMVKVCYVGYNNLLHRRGLTEQNREKAEYALFEGELNTDEVICFIATYGTQYEYVLVDGVALYGSKNLSEKMVSMLVRENYIISGAVPRSMSLVSVDLLDPTYVNNFDEKFTMVGYILDNAKFRLRCITYEGTELDITRANDARVIIIERV